MSRRSVNEILNKAQDNWGWALALVVGMLMVVLAVVALPLMGADTTPLTSDSNTVYVPASGVDGFPVEAFCNDSLTKVTYTIIPDVGESHELLRVKNGVTELVTLTTTFDGTVYPGTHYYDTTLGQQKEPAIADKKAMECVRDKRQLKRP